MDGFMVIYDLITSNKWVMFGIGVYAVWLVNAIAQDIWGEDTWNAGGFSGHWPTEED